MKCSLLSNWHTAVILSNSSEYNLVGTLKLGFLTNEIRDKWVPVTTAWRILRLRMEERPPIWRQAANILNK